MEHKHIIVEDDSDSPDDLRRLIDAMDNQSRFYLYSMSLEDGTLTLTWMKNWCPSQWKRDKVPLISSIMSLAPQIQNTFLPEFKLTPSLRKALEFVQKVERRDQIETGEGEVLKDGALQILDRRGLIQADYDVDLIPPDAFMPPVIYVKQTLRSLALTEEGRAALATND